MSDTSSGGRVDALLGKLQERDLYMVLATVLVIYLLFSVVLFGRTIGSALGALEGVTFFMLVYAITALALNLHWGYAGLFNIGVAGFMAVGVYTMTILTRAPDANPAGLGLPIWAGIIAGMAMAAVVGLLAALPALRLRADYLAIVTLGLSEIIRYTLLSSAVDSWMQESTAGVVERFGGDGEVGLGTNGGSGLSITTGPEDVLDRLFYVGGDPSQSENAFGQVVFELGRQLGVRTTLIADIAYLFLLTLMLGLVYLLLYRVGNSPFGRVLKAIREDELVAKSLGKNTDLFKIKVFMLGCALMGLAGILWQGSQDFVSPTSFMPIVTFYVFVALIIGGAGSNTGSVIGGFLFASLLFEAPRRVGGRLRDAIPVADTPNTFAEAFTGPLEFLAYLTGNVGAVQFILLGVVLILIIQRRPDGVLGHRSEPAAAVNLGERSPEGESK